MGENRLMCDLYEENQRLKARIEELESKHFVECTQIAQYSDELRKANELLRESLPVLHKAFFANYKDTNAANELYDKIKAAVGSTLVKNISVESVDDVLGEAIRVIKSCYFTEDEILEQKDGEQNG